MTRLACSFTFLAAAVASAVADQPLHVTVQQLVATPRKFDGKRVDSTGYYRASLEDSSLFVSSEAARQVNTHNNCIWLEPDIWDPRIHPHRPPNVADVDQVRGHTVRVVGTSTDFAVRSRTCAWAACPVSMIFISENLSSRETVACLAVVPQLRGEGWEGSRCEIRGSVRILRAVCRILRQTLCKPLAAPASSDQRSPFRRTHLAPCHVTILIVRRWQ